MSSYVQVYRRSLLFLGLLAVIPVGGFQELLKKALTHHQSGDLKEAVGYYGRLKEKLGASTPVAVLSNYGAALLGLDLISEAEEVWRDALRDLATDTRRSYAETRARAARVGGWLRRHLKAGDRVALVAPNSILAFEAHYACAFGGLTLLNCNNRNAVILN